MSGPHTLRRRLAQVGCATAIALLLLVAAIARPVANTAVLATCFAFRGIGDPQLLPYAERGAWSWFPQGRRLAIHCLNLTSGPEVVPLRLELAQTTRYPDVWAGLLYNFRDELAPTRRDLWDAVDLRSVEQLQALMRAIRLERATERTEVCVEALTLNPYSVRAEAVECLTSLDREAHMPRFVALARTEDDYFVQNQLGMALRESNRADARSAWSRIAATEDIHVFGTASASATWMDDALFEIVATPDHPGQRRAVTELAERRPERLMDWCRDPLLRFRVEGADAVCREKVLPATQPATPPG